MTTPDPSTLLLYVAATGSSPPPGVTTNPMLVYKDVSGYATPVSVGYAIEDGTRFTVSKDSSTQEIVAATGAIGDAVWPGSGNGTLVAIGKAIWTKLGSVVIGAGSAIIGRVGIDQTTPGTTNGVVVNESALPANAAQETGGNLTAILTKLGSVVLGVGSAIIGRVGIDQTTPGTTNKVTVGSDVVNTQTANSGSWTDHSVSQPAALTQLATMTVAHPGAYFIQNQSADILQAIFDDGATGPTTFLLASGGLGQAGGIAPVLPGFVGRIQVCGPASSQFAARSN